MALFLDHLALALGRGLLGLVLFLVVGLLAGAIWGKLEGAYDDEYPHR